jgi:RNA polymerase sigma-70 factor (ECF subfamily)
MAPTPETDDELLHLYRNSGRTDYFGKLFDRYIPLVYGLCLKYLRDEDDARDAVMQLFEELLSKVMKHDIQNFKTWLYTVSRNHCLQLLRDRERAAEVEFNSDFMESDTVLHLLDEDDDDSGRVRALLLCMEKLPEQQRVSINHFFKDGLSYSDIVDATGYPLLKVKSFIQNGKRNLKICIEKTCNI